MQTCKEAASMTSATEAGVWKGPTAASNCMSLAVAPAKVPTRHCPAHGTAGTPLGANGVSTGATNPRVDQTLSPSLSRRKLDRPTGERPYTSVAHS